MPLIRHFRLWRHLRKQFLSCGECRMPGGRVKAEQLGTEGEQRQIQQQKASRTREWA